MPTRLPSSAPARSRPSGTPARCASPASRTSCIRSGVARICAELRAETPVIVAALLHDTVEDTETTLEEIAAEFGDDVALLVDGVTKLSRIHFDSREQAQAESYRKMVLSMARDVRVVIVKLADRLHNMRTLGPLAKQKQLQNARETLEVYAPIAHRLGIHQMKWELEDLAFTTLHPRRYAEIEALVSQRRADREEDVAEAARILDEALREVAISAEILGRAKHFYSIYQKMARGGKEFNEILDLTAMRVLVDSVKDCYGAIGVLHALWKPIPGRFKDYVAMPKSNGYQSLHTTVIGPKGQPLEIQVRTHAMHQTAEYGVAAHWIYKHRGEERQLAWLGRVVDAAGLADPAEFMDSLMGEMFDDEVFVFTPQGEVKALPSGATPLDFAYAVHTDVGHRCVGAKVNGRIVPLHSELASGDIVEILTSNRERGPSRDWLTLVRTSRARNKIRQWFAHQQREDLEQKGRDSLAQAFRSNGLPSQKLSSAPLLAQLIREMGFKKADDFYVAIGGGKVPVGQVVNKVLQRLKTTEVAEEQSPATRRHTRARVGSSAQYGVVVDGTTDPNVLVRMAKCCTPVPGDPITGYISVGRGITIHREDCPNVRALKRSPERFCPVSWDGEASQSFRVEIAVDGWDRARLLEDIGRTFAENGCNIVEYGGVTQDQMAKNWYVAEVGDVKELKSVLSALRNIESVFDAYRVTPRARPGRLTRAHPGVRRSAQDVCGRLRGRPRHHASASRRVRRSACSGRTEPARPPRCACSARCCRRRSGRAPVAGHDVVREAGAVRRAIGFAMQEAGPGPLRHRPRAPAHDGAPVRALARADALARRRAARPVRARGGRRPAGADVLGRHAPAHRPGLRARAPAAPAVPRRAHDRRRPDLARRALGGAAAAAGRGRLAVPDDALPRGGRPPLRPARDRRPRRDRRARHAGRAQGRGRRRRRHRGADATARRRRPPPCWSRSAACASRAAGAASRSS